MKTGPDLRIFMTILSHVQEFARYDVKGDGKVTFAN
jgi:hypothetical protein